MNRRGGAFHVAGGQHAQIARVGEGSPLRSIRDASSLAQRWKDVERLKRPAEHAQREIQALWRQLNGIRVRNGRMVAMTAYYPFKVYASPSAPAATADEIGADPRLDPDNAWRMFRVRAGRVYYTDTKGTDGLDFTGTTVVDADGQSPSLDPDNAGVPEWDDSVDILVPASYFFFVWVEFGAAGAGAVVRYGDDPSASTWTSPEGVPGETWTSTNAWDTDGDSPVADASHKLIATIDTTVDPGEDLPVVRQWLRQDVQDAGGAGACLY